MLRCPQALGAMMALASKQTTHSSAPVSSVLLVSRGVLHFRQMTRLPKFISWQLGQFQSPGFRKIELEAELDELVELELFGVPHLKQLFLLAKQ